MFNQTELLSADEKMFHGICMIRRFEETVLENFSRGVFFGTTHTYLGQEANAVGVLSNLLEQDIVFSNHRCHGHFLAYGGDPRRLFAELMGKSSGICAGRGGSQHLQWKNFYSNGILGGTIPIATGMALAELRKGSQAATIAFLGDGALGEGVVYELLNMAGLWHIPILYVLENNQIAQTTPIDKAISGGLAERFSAFNICVEAIELSDVRLIQDASARLLNEVRDRQTPCALVVKTYRFGPHSKGDDTRKTEEIALFRQKHDPLKIQGARLHHDRREHIETSVRDEIAAAYQQAQKDPLPEFENAASFPAGNPNEKGIHE